MLEACKFWSIFYWRKKETKEELRYKQLFLCMTEQEIWKRNTVELDLFPENPGVLLGYVLISTVFQLKIISHSLDFGVMQYQK